MNDEKDPQGNPWIKSAMIWAGVIIALLLFVSLFERPTTQAGLFHGTGVPELKRKALTMDVFVQAFKKGTRHGGNVVQSL